MAVTDQAEADTIFERLVALAVEDHGIGHLRADILTRENLAYFAGYYSHETRARVERLFRCAHPFFGAIAEKGPPTPEQALEMGRQYMRAYLESPKAVEDGERLLKAMAQRKAEQ